MSTQALHPRILAHVGDAVYELFVRETVLAEQLIGASPSPGAMHRACLARVNAQFQADLLSQLQPLLTEEENEVVRQARNQPVSSGRRHAQALHRQSTAFEALIGYAYLCVPDRLTVFWQVITPLLSSDLKNPRERAL